jgi:hypothetical protein
VCATWWEGHQSGDDAPNQGTKDARKEHILSAIPCRTTMMLPQVQTDE